MSDNVEVDIVDLEENKLVDALEKEENLEKSISTQALENEKIKIFRNINYTELDEDKLRCNIFSPNVKEKQFPTIIFVHGGSWKRGDRNHWYFDLYSKTAEFFATNGFVVVVPSYRLSPDVIFPSHANDVSDCLLWTNQNISKFGGDPNAIYLMGHSAGGHIVTQITVDLTFLKQRNISSDIVKACVGICGVYNIHELSETFVSKKFIVEPSFGYEVGNYKNSSPFHVELAENSKSTPFFFINAYYDLGLEKHAVDLVKKLKEFGNSKVKHVTYSGTDHLSIIGLGTSMGYAHPNMLEDILTFLKENLSKE
jgi:acetyl esterase/lipase